jgi:putative tricarboxylic transport membrane protein
MRETMRELGLAVVLTAFAVFGLIASALIKVGAAVTDPIGPARYPQLLFLLFLALSLVYLVRQVVKVVRERRSPAVAEAEEAEDDPEKSVSVARPVLVVAALVGYVLVLDILGYVVSTTLLLFVIHIIFGVRKKWWFAVIVTVVASIVLKLFFGELLLVPLPTGPWLF